MNKFSTDEPFVQPLPRESREYLHTARAAVAVPFGHSVITAAIVTAIALVPILALRLRGMGWVLAMLFLIVLARDWRKHQTHWFDLTSDYFTQPTQPKVSEAPTVAPSIIRIQLDRVTEQGHVQQSSFFDLPEGVTETMMADLANGILNMHRPFTEGEWCGSGKTFSKPKFLQLRALMEKRKLVEYKNEKSKQQGIQFNQEGEQFLERFLV